MRPSTERRAPACQRARSTFCARKRSICRRLARHRDALKSARINELTAPRCVARRLPNRSSVVNAIKAGTSVVIDLSRARSSFEIGPCSRFLTRRIFSPTIRRSPSRGQAFAGTCARAVCGPLAASSRAASSGSRLWGRLHLARRCRGGDGVTFARWMQILD